MNILLRPDIDYISIDFKDEIEAPWTATHTRSCPKHPDEIFLHNDVRLLFFS